MQVTSEFITLEQYLDLIRQFPASMTTMYHQAAWLQAVRDGFGIDIRGVVTAEHGGKMIAITPFMVTKKGPFCLLGSPLSGLYTEFAGPIFQEYLDDGMRNLVLISQHQLARSCGHYIEWGEIERGNELSAWRKGLEVLGYDYSARPTIVVDMLDGEEAVWNRFQGRARNMIRKSEKAGVEVKIVKATPKWVEAYYAMLKETFQRQGRPVPHPLSFYHQLGKLAEEGMARFVSAECDGRLIANAIFLLDGKRMLYLSGTANADGMKLAANSLIQWGAIRAAIADGVSSYDMGGLGVPSIDKFKRSFGGKEIQHHRWVYRTRLFQLFEPVAIWASKKGIIRMGRR